MHWKVTRPNPPKHGDTKTVTRRAWLPHIIGEMRIWLEQYTTLYVYIVTAVPVNGSQAVEVGEWKLVAQKPVKWALA